MASAVSLLSQSVKESSQLNPSDKAAIQDVLETLKRMQKENQEIGEAQARKMYDDIDKWSKVISDLKHVLLSGQVEEAQRSKHEKAIEAITTMLKKRVQSVNRALGVSEYMS
jgi:hypothetical protein